MSKDAEAEAYHEPLTDNEHRRQRRNKNKGEAMNQGGYQPDSDPLGEPPRDPDRRKPEYDFSDQVNHPSHYNQGKIETIEFLEDKFMKRPHEWNACKYLDRSGSKQYEGLSLVESAIKDLNKAVWYIRRRISILKGDDVRPNDMPKEEPKPFVETKMGRKLLKEREDRSGKNRLPDVDLDCPILTSHNHYWPIKKPSPDIMIAVPKSFLSDVHDTVVKNISFLNELAAYLQSTNYDGKPTLEKMSIEKDLLSRIAIAASDFRNNGLKLPEMK